MSSYERFWVSRVIREVRREMNKPGKLSWTLEHDELVVFGSGVCVSVSMCEI